MFENSVHFLPTFRTPYTTFENNSVPVPFTHLRVQNFSVLCTSFFEINPYTSCTCTSLSFFTHTPYCFRFRTLVRMTEYVRIRTRIPGSGADSSKLIVGSEVRVPTPQSQLWKVKSEKWKVKVKVKSEKVKWSVFGPLLFLKLIYVIGGTLT